MDFRWIAVIALWTALSGPIFATPTGSAWATGKRKACPAKVAKKASAPQTRR
jgi:hypothetical protein